MGIGEPAYGRDAAVCNFQIWMVYGDRRTVGLKNSGSYGICISAQRPWESEK